MQLPSIMVRRAMKAGRVHDWSEVMKSEELNPCTMAKLKESHIQVRQDDDQRKSVVQQIMQKSADFLRRTVEATEGQRRVTPSYVCPNCHRYPLEEYIWWISTVYEKNSATGGARHAAANTT